MKLPDGGDQEFTALPEHARITPPDVVTGST